MTDDAMIEFTPEQARELRRAYEHALRRGDECFTWRGKTLLTSYVKFMLMVLDQQFMEDQP